MAWLTGWDYRKKITIDQTKVDADLTAFPVLVKRTSADTDFWPHCNSRENLTFTSSDGTTELYSEVERFDHTGDNLEAWVNVPSVSGTVDTEFYMYYDSASPTHGKTDSTSTWDSDFKGVWHMRDLTSTTVKDSTTSGLDGTKLAAGEPVEADAKIGLGQNYDGSNDRITTGDFTVPMDSPLTLEAWVYIASDVADYNGILFHSASGSEQVGICDDGIGDCWRFYLRNQGYVLGSARSLSTWYHIVMVFDGSTLKSYVNGAIDANQASAGYGGFTIPFQLGYWNAGHTFSGKIDEARVSLSARSAAWIKATYNSGNDTLVSYGTEETSGPTLISVSDSGVGEEVAALIISASDSGLGADVLSALSASISVADSGTGSDTWKKIKTYLLLLKMLPGARTFVRRVADFDVSRDATSGHRIPIFTETSIEGLLIEQGGDVPGFAPGVVMTQDAVFYTFDTELAVLDQIRDDDKIFQVAEIEEKLDQDGALVYRACHLHRLELYQEGA